MDGIMANSKPKNGKTSSQDYMNLLYSDSESDTVPDLKLPPLRGKKTRRRGLRRQSDDSICSLWMILRIIIISVLLISVVTLGVITYFTLQQVNELKDKINTLENKNAGTPEEFQALQFKLASVNKTVLSLRTGKYGLEDLNRTIVSMQKQITSLTAVATQLQKTVQTPEPDDKETLAVAKTVADLGANLQLTQTAVENLKTSQKSFASQLDDLASRVSQLENPGGREGGSSPTSALSIQTLLSEINSTFTRSIGLAMENLDRQQSQLDAVDKFTQDVDSQLKNVSQAVVNLTRSQQHLTDLMASQQEGARQQADQVGSEEGGTPGTEASLAQLQTQVQHLQLLVNQMQSDSRNRTETGEATDSSGVSPGKVDLQSLVRDHEDFVVFRTQVFQDINYLNTSLAQVNASVDILNQDVEEVFAKLGTAMLDISNVTTVVENLTSFLLAHRGGTGAADTATPGAQDNSAITATPPVKQSPPVSGSEQSDKEASPMEEGSLGNPGKESKPGGEGSSTQATETPESQGTESAGQSPGEKAGGSSGAHHTPESTAAEAPKQNGTVGGEPSNPGTESKNNDNTETDSESPVM